MRRTRVLRPRTDPYLRDTHNEKGTTMSMHNKKKAAQNAAASMNDHDRQCRVVGPHIACAYTAEALGVVSGAAGRAAFNALSKVAPKTAGTLVFNAAMERGPAGASSGPTGTATPAPAPSAATRPQGTPAVSAPTDYPAGWRGTATRATRGARRRGTTGPRAATTTEQPRTQTVVSTATGAAAQRQRVNAEHQRIATEQGGRLNKYDDGAVSASDFAANQEAARQADAERMRREQHARGIG